MIASPSMNQQLNVQQAQLQEPETEQRNMNVPVQWALEFETSVAKPMLGKGTFGHIVQVVQRASGHPFAMKVCERHFFSARGMENQLKTEVETLRRAADRKCRHVVRLLDVVADTAYVHMLMELCTGGNLQDIAQSRPGKRIPEPEALPLVVQLFTGLLDLHANSILHRDIKPENLLLTADGSLKIADFGWATDTSKATSSMAGTFHYMAPEVLEGKRVHTEAIDVWSSGATLFEILTGHLVIAPPPETGHSVTDQHRGDKMRIERLLTDISSKCPLPADHRFPFLSENCWALLTQTLMPNAERRITVSDALQSSWLQPSLPQRHVVSRRASGELSASASAQILTVKRAPGRDSPLSTSRSEASTRVPSRSESGTPPVPLPFPAYALQATGLGAQLAALKQTRSDSRRSMPDPSVARLAAPDPVRRLSLKGVFSVGSKSLPQYPVGVLRQPGLGARRTGPSQSPHRLSQSPHRLSQSPHRLAQSPHRLSVTSRFGW